MHLKSLVLIIAVLVNMATTLPDPHDLQNPQENQVNHSASQDKHGHQSDGQKRHGHHSDGHEGHGHHFDGQEGHGHHSEVENLQPQSRPIPTKQDSGAHHHVHSTSTKGVPHQTQFSQFFPPQQFGQSQHAQQFGRFPQGQFPFGYQQPSPQLLNCQCYPVPQPFSHFQAGFQQPLLYNALPAGFQHPSFQQPTFQQPSFQQPSQQFTAAFPNGFQQQQSSSKDPRSHCHVTCHEH